MRYFLFNFFFCFEHHDTGYTQLQMYFAWVVSSYTTKNSLESWLLLLLQFNDATSDLQNALCFL